MAQNRIVKILSVVPKTVVFILGVAVDSLWKALGISALVSFAYQPLIRSHPELEGVVKEMNWNVTLVIFLTVFTGIVLFKIVDLISQKGKKEQSLQLTKIKDIIHKELTPINTKLNNIEARLNDMDKRLTKLEEDRSPRTTK